MCDPLLWFLLANVRHFLIWVTALFWRSPEPGCRVFWLSRWQLWRTRFVLPSPLASGPTEHTALCCSSRVDRILLTEESRHQSQCHLQNYLRSNSGPRGQRFAANRLSQGMELLKDQEYSSCSFRFSPYRAVNTHRLGYKNQSVNAV